MGRGVVQLLCLSVKDKSDVSLVKPFGSGHHLARMWRGRRLTFSESASLYIWVGNTRPTTMVVSYWK